MTRDDIIRMAEEAGFVIDEKARQHQPNCIFHTHHMIDEGLTRFAALVAAAEREACAMIAEEKTTAWTEYDYNSACMDCAKAIRARGET